MTNCSLKICDQDICATKSVRNLGVVYDSELLMEKHISQVSSSVNMHLRNIGRIRKYLTEEATKTLVHSLVISRLDYGNSLLYGLPKTQIGRLQKIQNKAARLITRSPRSDHITPVLMQLHWLPVEQRIFFKIALQTYKAVNGLAPRYLCDLVTKYKPARSLRSGNRNLLDEPQGRLSAYGNRSFMVSAPKVWNSLPLEIREADSVTGFKSKLKTYLFRKVY